jgi:hypothetical protein
MEKNLVKYILNNGGDIYPLIIPSELTNGTGLMNPSVMVKEGKIFVVIRHVNYTFYHSEKKLFQHPYGPLTYIHPENDLHLRTLNWFCELSDNFEINKFCKIDTSKFDIYEPLWEFVGLEDARLIEWDNKLYISGVRRDTTTNGQGRMELSELEIDKKNWTAKEVSRIRIEAPIDKDSYCEKNWMPILDRPFQYIKWTSPTEVVKADPKTGKSQQLFVTENVKPPTDQRGGSQVLQWGKYYIAITHEVVLFKNYLKQKNGTYRHRLCVWDEKFTLIGISPKTSSKALDTSGSLGITSYPPTLISTTLPFADSKIFKG